jgi:Multiubiquitin
VASTEAKEKTVTITVNNKSVVMDTREATGLEIKTAAKAQGVEIQLDFQLWLEAHGDQPMRSIGDDDVVKLHNKLAFTCNTGDHDS